MLVLKFGGSSVSSVENIARVKNVLLSKSDQFVVVVSAFGGVTDELDLLGTTALNGGDTSIDTLKQRHVLIAKELLGISNQSETLIHIQKEFNQLERLCDGIQAIGELSSKSKAHLLSFGERLSSFIICAYLKEQGLEVELLPRNVIRANGDHLQATVDLPVTKQQAQKAVQDKCYVSPGFVGENDRGEVIVLGRGGSDYTAALLAEALEADGLEIWSDVDGMLNASPKLVDSPACISHLSYDEAFELSHFGAKVLYPPSIRPVMRAAIPLVLKNTFKPEHPGSLIDGKTGQQHVIGISALDDVAIIVVSGVGMGGEKGTASRVFNALSAVNIVLIAQCCSEQSICVGIAQADVALAEAQLNAAFESEVSRNLINPISSKKDYSIIALVGDNMKEVVGLSGAAFSALGENGVNLTAVAQGASERNISLVVAKADEKKAVNILHERFFKSVNTKIHLFVAGIGNVGGSFLKIVKSQQERLAEQGIDLVIAGMANRTKMLLNENGVSGDMRQAKALVSIDDFVDAAIDLNLRNSVFIDNTASDVVAHCYEKVLLHSISVVACNKIACSDSYNRYAGLLALAKEKNCDFKYETCVGAALPIIKTIQDQVMSGDEIAQIDAVLSGSLNFIFNAYDGSESFASVVRQAADEGYTEPNPLIDLSGVDVSRKILILAREAGYPLEMEQVVCESFLPEVEEANLYASLDEQEPYFLSLFESAKSRGNKLKVVATLKNGKASVSLQEVGADSPLYELGGKDNIVSIHSKRYEDPLVIRGAGAGAEVTASGVFADLMLIVNRRR